MPSLMIAGLLVLKRKIFKYFIIYGHGGTLGPVPGIIYVTFISHLSKRYHIFLKCYEKELKVTHLICFSLWILTLKVLTGTTQFLQKRNTHFNTLLVEYLRDSYLFQHTRYRSQNVPSILDLILTNEEFTIQVIEKAMNRNWSNQKANPALKTKTGNK